MTQLTLKEARANAQQLVEFFDWLETRSYKMHVRVLLSRYRAYTPCAECDGARLKTDALLWRIRTSAGSLTSTTLVNATGGLSAPKLVSGNLLLFSLPKEGSSSCPSKNSTL